MCQCTPDSPARSMYCGQGLCVMPKQKPLPVMVSIPLLQLKKMREVMRTGIEPPITFKSGSTLESLEVQANDVRFSAMCEVERWFSTAIKNPKDLT